MIGVTKPFKLDMDYTILEPFDITDKIYDFKKLLESNFFKPDKDITKFRMGCAKETARLYAENQKKYYDEISISPKLLEISNIQDAVGRNVFENSQKIFGWLIFIDEDTFANWGHDCKYIFYAGKKEGTDEEVIFEESMIFPPAGIFPMEVI